MILSQKQIEEIAAAVTEDFNKFFFGTESEEVRMARATPIDQFARDYQQLILLSAAGKLLSMSAFPLKTTVRDRTRLRTRPHSLRTMLRHAHILRRRRCSLTTAIPGPIFSVQSLIG